MCNDTQYHLKAFCTQDYRFDYYCMTKLFQFCMYWILITSSSSLLLPSLSPFLPPCCASLMQEVVCGYLCHAGQQHCPQSSHDEGSFIQYWSSTGQPECRENPPRSQTSSSWWVRTSPSSHGSRSFWGGVMLYLWPGLKEFYSSSKPIPPFFAAACELVGGFIPIIGE